MPRKGAGRARIAPKDIKKRSLPRGRSTRAGEAPSFGPQDILDKAEEFLHTFQHDLAIKFCDKVLEVDGADARALEIKAVALLESGGDVEVVRELLQAAIAADPDDGHSKYLYLGQISEGHEAVEHISAGIHVLDAECGRLHQAQMHEALLAAQSEISAAFCSLAEVYLTELCDEDEAQQVCLDCMEKALQYDANNVQALQTMSSIHISLEQPEAAMDWLKQSLALWHRPPKESEEAVEDDGDDDWEDDDSDEEDERTDAMMADVGAAAAAAAAAGGGRQKRELPPYEFRISTAKLLIELGDHTTACEVLDKLLVDDDEVVQVWYLMGWAHFLLENKAQAAEYLVHARDLYSRVGSDQEDIFGHIVELLAQLPEETKAAEAAAAASAAPGGAAPEGAAAAAMAST